ncbi:MAG TPA: DUF1559 domain-containing protein [Thermoguttaceae bacterium]|nr:DUF1559 domain-containing protein [Thermoguttaceae bacterium]
MSDAPSSETGLPPREKPFQFSLRTMLIGVTVFALALGILVPLVRRIFREQQRAVCTNNLKQIGLALHNYHDVYRCFPFAHVCGPDGKSWHSWRMAVLPFLESSSTYDEYRFDEPWDGPNNRKLHSRQMYVYRCPVEAADPSVPATTTSYLAVVGPGTAWPVPGQTRIADFKDGASNSILIVEVLDSGIHWMEPRDLKLEELELAINPKSGQGITSRHIGGACVLLADGSVHFLPSDTAPETLRSLFTIADGEPDPWDDLPTR